MRRAAIAMVTAIVAILGSILLVGLSTITVAISSAGNVALVVPGTGNTNPTPGFINAEVRNFVTPTNPACGSGPMSESPTCPQIAVIYPASFWPIILFGLKQLYSDTWNVSVDTGVDNLGTQLRQAYAADPEGHFYLVGYSQGATVDSYFKRDYPTDPQSQGLPPLDQLTFVFAANPNRPNGGLFMRPGIFGPFTIPILNATVGIPAPTDTGVRTSDVVIKYDGVSDFPVYPINLLAVANATAGLLFIHPTYVWPNDQKPQNATRHPYGYTVDEFTALVSAAQQAADNGQCTEAVHCQQFGDTTYITLPTTDLPILALPRYIGEQTGFSWLTRPLADLVQPVMTVLIETGYDRTSYGTPTPFRLIPIIDPVSLTVQLVAATFQGINDAIGDITGARPAPPPTQDPFATAADLFTDSPAPSSLSTAATPALEAAAASSADATPTDTTLSTTTTTGAATTSDTTSTTDATATTTGGAGTTPSTLDMTNGAKFSPGTTPTGTGTPGAQDPITSLVSGATAMVGSLIAGLTGVGAPATKETSTAADSTASDSTGSASSGTTQP